MSDITRILIPVDGSEHARNAIAHPGFPNKIPAASPGR